MSDIDIEIVLELFSAEDDSLVIVEAGEWVDDGKYSNKETIVKYNDKFYAVNQYRSGSYFTDYDYGDPSCVEVAPKEITKTVWVPK